MVEKIIVIIPKSVMNSYTLQIMDVAKKEGRLKELYNEKSGGFKHKLYKYLSPVLEPLHESDLILNEEDKRISEFLMEFVKVFKKPSRTGHKVIHLGLKNKMIEDNDKNYKFELEVEEK